MKTRKYFLILALLNSFLVGCVTVPKDSPPSASPVMYKVTPGPGGAGLSKPKVELVPRGDNPNLYDYKVIEMAPGSPFVKAGIKPLDVILSIDGKPVGTMEEVLKVTSTIDSGNFSQIVVRRQGKNYLIRAKKR